MLNKILFTLILSFEAIEIRDEICQNKNVIHTGTLFTPLLRYKGSAKISVVTEYNPNFPIQLVATGTILKIIIIMKKKIPLLQKRIGSPGSS